MGGLCCDVSGVRVAVPLFTVHVKKQFTPYERFHEYTNTRPLLCISRESLKLLAASSAPFPPLCFEVKPLPHANVLNALLEPHAHGFVLDEAMRRPYLFHRCLRVDQDEAIEQDVVGLVAQFQPPLLGCCRRERRANCVGVLRKPRECCVDQQP